MLALKNSKEKNSWSDPLILWYLDIQVSQKIFYLLFCGFSKKGQYSHHVKKTSFFSSSLKKQIEIECELTAESMVCSYHQKWSIEQLLKSVIWKMTFINCVKSSRLLRCPGQFLMNALTARPGVMNLLPVLVKNLFFGVIDSGIWL